MTTREQNWQWFGNAGHLIVGHDCRFHLCTKVGKYLVSTVGQYWPSDGVREIIAQSRGVTLGGRGDARRADYMKKIGYEEIGSGRTFETFVFKAGPPCIVKDCNCGQPSIDGSELDTAGYNNAGDATRGHLRICKKWAKAKAKLRKAA